MQKPWFHPALTPVQRINRIGEELYPKFKALWELEKDTLPPAVNAGRLTGMTLELPLKEIDELLENPEKLRATYEAAKRVILDAEARKQQ